MRAASLQDLWRLAGGVDVELALEDVVNDGLAEVIHDMSVPMLQGQSGDVGEEKGVRVCLVGSGATLVSPEMKELAEGTLLPTP